MTVTETVVKAVARAGAGGTATIAEAGTVRQFGRRPEALELPAAFVLTRWYLCSIAILAALAVPRSAIANGGDLPPEVVLQGFAKPEDGRLRLLVRVPLVLLSSFGLPKRGLGYLDLARINDKLKEVAAATGRQIELREDGVPLVPIARQARVSVLSDRSFAGYTAALAHMEGPPLAASTDLFWNQGFFDAELEYPLRSLRADLSLRMNVAPELGQRLKLQLEFLPAGEPARSYVIPGGSGWIALDPRWYEAARFFVKAGFVDAFAIDRLVFLLCMVAPFRQFRSLLAVLMVMTGLQALTLTAPSEGAVAGIRWLGPLFDTGLAGAVVLLAIGNLAAPSLRRRWLIGALVGALGGFGLGGLLADAWQFAGTHTAVSAVSFNVGVVLGEVASLVLALAALRLLFACVLGPPLGVVVLSAVLGHVGWHWMMDGSHELGHELEHAAGAGFSSPVLAVALWLVPALLVGGMACLLPRRFGGPPIPSLLCELFGRTSVRS